VVGPIVGLLHCDVVQIQRRDGQWVDAVPIPDTVLVNVADLLQRWTSDYLVSAVGLYIYLLNTFLFLR